MRSAACCPGEFSDTTITEVFRADRQPTEQDRLHRELRIEAVTGKIWQEGCGDFATVEPSASPDPAAQPSPEPEEKVYLDLERVGGGAPDLGGGERCLDRGVDRPRGRAERDDSVAVPRPDRRAIRPARGMHPGRDPDLDADAIAVSDAVANARTDPGADADADPADADADPADAHADPADTHAGALELGDRGALAALLAAAAADPPYSRVLAERLAHGSTQCPGTDAVHDDDAVEPGEQGVVKVGLEALQGGLHPFAVQVQRR